MGGRRRNGVGKPLWQGLAGQSATGDSVKGAQSYYCMDNRPTDRILPKALAVKDIIPKNNAAQNANVDKFQALNVCGEYDTYDGTNLKPEPAYNNGHF